MFFNGVKRSNYCNCPIRSLNFNQEVTAAGSKVDLTMVRVHSNKRHVRDLAPVSTENKRCTSQQTRITIVEIVHRRPLADLVYQANLTVKRVNFSFSSWEKQVLSLVDGKRRNLALVSDFVSWDSASLVPRHKITHSCKIPPLSIHS